MPKYIYIPYTEHKTVTKFPFVSKLMEIGDFSVSSNLDSTKIDKTQFLFQNSVSYTLDSLSLNTLASVTLSNNSTEITLNVDNKDITSYLKYSSLEKNILIVLDYIFRNYPASLYVKNNVNNKIGDNVINAYYNEVTNTTSFIVNTNFIFNPLEISYLSVDLPNTQDLSKYRILKDFFESYSVEVDGELYKISNFEGSNRFQNSFITFEVIGNPFVNGNFSKDFYIVPNSTIVDDFNNNAPLLVKVLLETEKIDGFYAEFKDKILTNGVVLNYFQTFVLPKADKYNPILYGNIFENYKTSLLDYSIKQDEVNTNILLRKYVETNLTLPVLESLELTENQSDKLETLLAVYAFSFDERFKFINNLKNIRFLSYDNRNNISDDLLSLYLSSLGIEIDNTLTNEQKKNFALNLTWLLKSKGTRAAVDFIFEFLNIPTEFIEFNEYIKVADNPIDIDLLKKYYKLVYGNSDVSKLSIDASGNPVSNDTAIFEDNDYWNQFYVLDESLNGKYINRIINVDTEETIYENDFTVTGTTFSYNLLSSTCYSDEYETDSEMEVQVDDCGCETEVEQKFYTLYTYPIGDGGCKPIVLDVWQECVGINEIKMHLTVFGGTPPLIYLGGIENGNILPSNQEYEIQIQDNNNCYSNIVTGTTYCYMESCFTDPIVANLYYTCNLDENNVPNGTVTVGLTFSGGTEPYIINGNENGDVLPVGETIATEVVDSLGCSSGIMTLETVCTSASNCVNLVYESTGECVSNIRSYASNFNVTYDISNVPFTTGIDKVIMTITEVSGATISGGSITQIFNNESGVFGFTADFGPSQDDLSTLGINVDVTIILLDGCTYTDNYDLSIDGVTVNSPSNYNNTLNPI